MARRKNRIEEGKNEDGNTSKGKNEDGSTSSSPPEYSSAETEGDHQDSNAEDSKAEEDSEEPISTRLRGKSGGAEMSSPEDEQSSEAQEAEEKQSGIMSNYPSWHPAHSTDELEKYESAQQQSPQLYKESSLSLDDIQNEGLRKTALAILQVKLDYDWTLPLIQFLHASTLTEELPPDTFEAVLAIGKQLFLLPLFYF